MNGKSKVLKKKNDFTVGTMIYFLTGCAAECYLLAVRQFYVNGSMYQLVAWDAILSKLTYFGLGLLIAGLVLTLLFRKSAGHRRMAAGLVLAVGVFLALSSWIIRTFYPNGVSLLCILVPVIVAFGILWKLYDRECFYAMVILAVTVLALWICRHGLNSIFWGKAILAGACCYIAVLVVCLLLFRRAEKAKGMLLRRRFLPADSNYLTLYGACGLSVTAMVVVLASTVAAYYAMWALALIIFALAVYYTVKQL